MGPDVLRRVRWGNIALAAAVVVALAAAIAWPRVAGSPPALPGDSAKPLVGADDRPAPPRPEKPAPRGKPVRSKPARKPHAHPHRHARKPRRASTPPPPPARRAPPPPPRVAATAPPRPKTTTAGGEFGFER
jgi:hypothetical protein